MGGRQIFRSHCGTLTTLVNCEDEDTARQEVERDLFAGDIEDWQVEEVEAVSL